MILDLLRVVIKLSSKKKGSFLFLLALSFILLAIDYAGALVLLPLSGSSIDQPKWIKYFLKFNPIESPQLFVVSSFIFIMIIRNVLGFLFASFCYRIGKKIHYELASSLFPSIIEAEPLESIYKKSVGHYLTIAGDDTHKAGILFSTSVMFVSYLMTTILIYILLIKYSVIVAISLFISILPCIFIVYYIFKSLKKINAQAAVNSRMIATSFVEAFGAIRSIRSLRAWDIISIEYLTLIKKYLDQLVRIDELQRLTKFVPFLVISLTSICIIYFERDVVSDSILLGCFLISLRFFIALGQTVGAASFINTELRAVGDIGSMLNFSSSSAERKISLRQHNETEIFLESFDLMELRYGFSGNPLLPSSLNYKFQIGKTYLITGRSGIGKSSLADVLAGLKAPLSGSISLVGVGREPISPAAATALVEQQPKIFSMTMGANIKLGAEISEHDLFKVIDICELNDLVASLPNGLNTEIKYLGENFSGGQVQRIAIARALIKKPPILILDEALSGLDKHTSKSILVGIREEYPGIIILLISHDAFFQSICDEHLNLNDYNFDV
jgi:ATP-binding cassette subfamily B protein